LAGPRHASQDAPQRRATRATGPASVSRRRGAGGSPAAYRHIGFPSRPPGDRLRIGSLQPAITTSL